MNHDALQAAVNYLDDLIHKDGGVGLPDSADQSPEANTICAVYGRCQLLRDMGRSALAGGTPNVIGRVISDENMRGMVESVEIWTTRTALSKMLDAAEKVYDLLP